MNVDYTNIVLNDENIDLSETEISYDDYMNYINNNTEVNMLDENTMTNIFGDNDDES